MLVDVEWPYTIPVFVLSNTRTEVPHELKEKVSILTGSLEEIIAVIHEQGYTRLYIDGGKVIQSLLEKDLIDELIITQFPILLGGGTPLFGSLKKQLPLKLKSTEVLLDALVKSTYQRVKNE